MEHKMIWKKEGSLGNRTFTAHYRGGTIILTEDAAETKKFRYCVTFPEPKKDTLPGWRWCGSEQSAKRWCRMLIDIYLVHGYHIALQKLVF